jgi:HEAT repeat protein
MSRDANIDVRNTAIAALAERDDPIARQLLVDLCYDEDERVRREAILGLVKAGVPEATEVVLKELPTADVRTQVAYIRALRDSESAAAAAALEQLALKGHQHVRGYAIEAWAHVAGDAATDKLVGLIGTERGVTDSVLAALGEIDSEASRLALRKASEEGDVRTANSSLHVLSGLEGDDIRALMLEELQGTETERIGTALSYFAQRGDDTCLSRVVDLARHGTPEAQNQAIDHLVGMGGAQARKTLMDIATQPGPQRMRALESLADAGIPSDQRIRLLESVIRDETHESHRAMGLLSREGGTEPVRIMMEVMRRGGPAARDAMHVLADRGGDEAVEALLRATRSNERGERVNALAALGRTGDPRALRELRAALEDPDPQVRRISFQHLSRQGGRHAEDAARTLLRSDNPMDRDMGLRALGDVRTKSAREEIVRAARDENLGGTALELLAGFDPPRAGLLAQEALRSGDSRRQLEALNLAHVLDAKTSSSMVEEALRSKDTEVLDTAMSHAVQSPAVERQLIALLRDEKQEPSVRFRAALVVQGWGGSAAQQAKAEITEALGR